MIIRAKTVYDVKALRVFIRGSKTVKLGLIILSLLLATAALMLAIVIAYAPSFNYIITLSSLIVIELFLIVYSYEIAAHIKARTIRERGLAESEVVFTDDEMTACYLNKDINGETSYKYSYLSGADEYDEYLIVHVSKTVGIIIDKSTITGGSAKDIAALFERNGVKYTERTKRK